MHQDCSATGILAFIINKIKKKKVSCIKVTLNNFVIMKMHQDFEKYKENKKNCNL